MSARRWATPTTRKSLAAATVAGLALALGAFAAPAQAAEQDISDVTLSWGLNLESGAGAFQPGACNFISAGKAGNSGSSRAWTEADGFYKSSEGNVKIVKDGPDNSTIDSNWGNKCQTGTGTPVSPSGTTNVSHNKVVLSNGTGTVDTTAKTAHIQWTGSFTSVFYTGLTYWSASDPELTVNADGTATLTATASGYGASMEDSKVWEAIAPKKITLANLTGVEVDADGFVKVPEYKNVTVPSSVTNQVTTGASWGAFPQDFVEFQGKTGTQAYWYSTGGSADPRKIATELSVDWTVEDVVPPVSGDDKNVDVDVKVPETVVEPEPEVFAWTMKTTSAELGSATQQAGGTFGASGKLPEITVTDTLKSSNGWSINGKASNFTATTGTFSGSALGWDPEVSAPTGTITEGAVVAAGNPGLGSTQTLASTAGTNTKATINAELELVAPAGTKAGNYTSRVTLTMVGE